MAKLPPPNHVTCKTHHQMNLAKLECMHCGTIEYIKGLWNDPKKSLEIVTAFRELHEKCDPPAQETENEP